MRYFFNYSPWPKVQFFFFATKNFFWLFLGIWSGTDKCNPVVPDVFWSAPNWVESLVLWCGWVEFIVGIIGKHDKVGDSLSIIIITSNFSKLETGKKCSVSFFQNRLVNKLVGKLKVLASLALSICCEAFGDLKFEAPAATRSYQLSTHKGYREHKQLLQLWPFWVE